MQEEFKQKRQSLEDEYNDLQKQKGVISEQSFNQKLSEVNKKSAQLEEEVKSQAAETQRN